MDIQIIKPKERLYVFHQSQQISMQTGFIGVFVADISVDGKDFYSNWDDFRKDLNTDYFKEDFDDVLSELRSPEGGILRNITTIEKYCYQNPSGSFKSARNEYGIRVDNNEHSFLFRLNPNKSEHNIYCYCYRKDLLDRHILKAEKGIRFINSNYKELFKIPDGEKIIVTSSWGEKNEHTCRYIDDYHCEVGNNLFHICEFAERMEQNKATYEPKNKDIQIKSTKRNREYER